MVKVSIKLLRYLNVTHNGCVWLLNTGLVGETFGHFRMAAYSTWLWMPSITNRISISTICCILNCLWVLPITYSGWWYLPQHHHCLITNFSDELIEYLCWILLLSLSYYYSFFRSVNWIFMLNPLVIIHFYFSFLRHSVLKERLNFTTEYSQSFLGDCNTLIQNPTVETMERNFCIYCLILHISLSLDINQDILFVFLFCVLRNPKRPFSFIL